MLKKTWWVILLATVLVLTIGLVFKAEKPEKVVIEYCELLRSCNIEEMSACLLPEEENVALALKDTGEYYVPITVFFREKTESISYEIGEPQIEGKTASIPVTFTYPDMKPLLIAAMGEILPETFKDALAGEDKDSEREAELFAKALNSQKKKVRLGTKEDTFTFVCEKTKDGWKITNADEGLLNIMTCNFFAAADELAQKNIS